MENELERMDTIISKDMSAFVKMNCPVDSALVEDFRIALLDETERIKTRIVVNASNFVARKADLKRYVQAHQQNLVGLSGKLLRYSHPEKLTRLSDKMEVPVLCHYSYRSLEDLLVFIERHFTGYFNPDAWVPLSYRLIAVQDISHGLEQLEKSLIRLKLDPNLHDSIFLAFWEFLDEECANEITYRKVKYLKTLKTELLSLVSDGKNDSPLDERIRQLLVSMNFNSAPFFTYYTDMIVHTVNQHDVPAQRLGKLAWCLKEINQVRDRHGFVYDPRYQPLKQQIASWIAEELNYRERSQQLPLGFTEGETVIPANAKIHFDLSVAQLACLIRVLMD